MNFNIQVGKRHMVLADVKFSASKCSTSFPSPDQQYSCFFWAYQQEIRLQKENPSALIIYSSWVKFFSASLPEVKANALTFYTVPPTCPFHFHHGSSSRVSVMFELVFFFSKEAWCHIYYFFPEKVPITHCCITGGKHDCLLVRWLGNQSSILFKQYPGASHCVNQE